jgi:hypothetical protein
LRSFVGAIKELEDGLEDELDDELDDELVEDELDEDEPEPVPSLPQCRDSIIRYMCEYMNMHA